MPNVTREWDEKLNSWVLKYDADVRKIDADASIDVTMSAEDLRVGKKLKQKTHSGYNTVAQAETDDSSTNAHSADSAQQSQSNGGDSGGQEQDSSVPFNDFVDKPLDLPADDEDDAQDGDNEEENTDEQQEDKQESESKSGNKEKKENSSAEQKDGNLPAPSVDNIFDRWDIEVYDHFVYFVNKKHKEVHIRFAHTVYVPHMSVDINTNDMNVIMDIYQDMDFISKPEFRKEQVDPLLTETYKTAA